MLLMLQRVFRVDKDVVKVSSAEVVKKAMQHLVNIALKGSRAIAEAKR
jgi:hypothetical protein